MSSRFLPSVALVGLLSGAMLPACAAHGVVDAVLVRMTAPVPRGEIIISQHLRRLFFSLGDGRAISYPVAVPKPGKQWRGATYIDGKYIRPAWSPPASVKHDFPNLPAVIAGGSPHNPMGVRALSLQRSEIAIHGTDMPWSIGHAVSYGCIRMHNADIRDLYARVSVGTRVIMEP